MFDLDYKGYTTIALIALLVIVTVVEMVFSYHEEKHLYNKKDTLQNIYLAALTFCINLFFKGVTFYILNFFYQYRLFEIKNIYLYWGILLVSQDFLYWVLHYVGHSCRLFWAMHVTHHSSSYFNISTGFRSTVFEPLYRVFFYLPLPLMGFSALDILSVYLLTQLYGNLVHTQINFKLPKWYGYIFVTPAHHRVHHASNIPYLDKNMGMMFILWDRLFGTFKDEDLPEKTVYGLTKPPQNLNASNVIFHEFNALAHDVKHAPDLKSKLGYIFNPPGWSHKHKGQTSKELQKKYEHNQLI